MIGDRDNQAGFHSSSSEGNDHWTLKVGDTVIGHEFEHGVIKYFDSGGSSSSDSGGGSTY